VRGEELSREQIEAFLAGLSAEEQVAFAQEWGQEHGAEHNRIWERSRADTWFWMRNYGRSLNLHVEVAEGEDRPEATVERFPDYPHLKIVATKLHKPCNVLIEKSRDMMATWSLCAVFLHDLMFYEGASLLMASKTFPTVDDGGPESTPDSLLGRVRFMYNQLPDWMRSRAPLRFKTGLVRNENTGGYITGQKAIRTTGRGGKFSRALADEFGFWPYAASNLSSLRYACQGGLILNSTPPEEGRHHEFGRIATSQQDYFHKIRLHWSMHPLRDAEWYQRSSSAMDPEAIARELDISYTGAVTARVYPMFDPEVHAAEEIEYDPKLPLYTAHDHGVNEETVLFIQVGENGDWFVIDEYQGGKEGEFTQRENVANLTPWDNAEAVVKILRAAPYRLVVGADGRIQGLAGSYGDPSGAVTHIVNKNAKRDDDKLTSYHSVWAQYGFNIQSKFTKQKDGIAIVRDKLKFEVGDDGGLKKRPSLWVSRRCAMTWDAFVHHRRKRDEGTGEYRNSVIEDWTKHPMDVVRYFAIGFTNVASHRRPARPAYREVWRKTATGARYPHYEVT
jgi:hypothetical protein